MTKSISTPNPIPRGAIKDDRGMARVKDVQHPTAPPVVETPSTEDSEKAIPVNRIESLMEVNFEDHRRLLTRVTTADKVGGVNDIFRDPTTFEETSLISLDEGVDVSLQPGCENFGDSLHEIVLEGDRAEVGGGGGRINLRKEDEEGSVDAREVNRVVEKVLENQVDVIPDKVPEIDKESRAETIRSWARVAVHVMKTRFDFLIRKGGGEGRARIGSSLVEVTQVEVPGARVDGSKEFGVQGVKGCSLGSVVRDRDPINMEDRDGIASEAGRSGGMEESGVFIPLQGKADFCPSFPVGSLLKNRGVEGTDSKGAKFSLEAREGAALLKDIKGFDKHPAVFPLLSVY